MAPIENSQRTLPIGAIFINTEEVFYFYELLMSEISEKPTSVRKNIVRKNEEILEAKM